MSTTIVSPLLPSGFLPGVVTRASTLRERLGGVVATSGDGRLARARLHRWCQVAAAGEPSILERRLAWDGLSTESALSALGQPTSQPERTPPWASLLELVLARAAAAAGDGDPHDALTLEPAIPFQEVLQPFLETAAANLYAFVHPNTGGLGSGARLGLERALLTRLSALCAPLLYMEFAIRRGGAGTGLSRLVALAGETDSEYRAFVREVLDGGLEGLLEEYPALARLTSRATLAWIESTAEFIRRLETDRPELEAAFAGGAGQGSVQAIATGLSDPHEGGRSVLRLTFASGLKVLYKPRDVGLERGYAQLVAWINEQGVDLPLQAAEVLARPGYGWVKQVEQQGVADEAAGRRYFRRAGMLTALFYGLGSTDCHQHNVVAAGEQPVLVDAETLLHPRVQPHGGADEVAGARTAARRWMEESVLESDFLPAWTGAGEGRSIDISGLGGVDQRESVILTPRWQRVNTDAMTLDRVFEDLPVPVNAVRLGERTLLPWQFSSEVEAGFRDMHRLLEERRDLMLAPDGPLAALEDTSVRFIFRPTLVYQRILDAAMAAGALRDGADFSLELERSARVFLKTEEAHPFRALHPEEQASLEQGDIPRFSVPAMGRTIETGRGGTAEVTAEVFAASPLEHAVERIRGFDQADRERQATLVRLALEARAPMALEVPAGPDDAGPADPDDAGEEGTGSPGYLAFAEEALVIADRLERLAIEAPDGGLAWIGLGFDDRTGRTSLRPVGLDLYGGQCGVAVFFAATAWVTADPRFRELALGALSPVLSALRECPENVVEEAGIGGAAGCASIVYGLVTCARLLREPDLVRAAQAAASGITRDRVAADRDLDVVAGAAGALLGLLSLHEATGSEEALIRALWCGEHLLDRRAPTPSGPCAWKSHGEQPLAGFAHGAAGIAYALARLSVVTERADFLAAAEEGIAYEAAIFRPDEANWPDLRPSPPGASAPVRVISAWCHGAAGVGLGRLAGLGVLDSAQVRADLAAAMQTTKAAGRGLFDQVCCGALGRVEALNLGGLVLASPELEEAARDLAGRTLVERPGGRFRLAPGVGSEDYAPGFFQGLSGIGYQLLRLAQPELPCVLVFEPS
ncbi:MAG: type 2 lanthipeptide synthetase LanM family protein [Candidatus Dormibacteraeota bacterium]|nr:type 2 lanthipeptide synthetase LanM family protein [Candidatus Dormibacteraeota bacterium]